MAHCTLKVNEKKENRRKAAAWRNVKTMHLTRIFSGEKYKGSKGYLNTQKKYELFRTLLYFAISFSLFAAGWITTGDRLNLLTVVAVLGCLPASKSAVETIMFFRFHSCDERTADQIDRHTKGLASLYDMVFTSYTKNYRVDHMTVKGNTICGFSSQKNFEEQEFSKHIDGILKAENYKDTTIKIFTDLGKYMDRLKQLQALDADDQNTEGIIGVLKSVAL
ncbi:MAG: hypothetical protein NC417_05400 [Candidatus Gastranaerophilales bacterium]|nr:hypothetical protein [Candidatus Gastranaerophilales bacterium]